MEFKIGVFGSAVGSTKEIEEKAYQIGKEIAKHNCALLSGGCWGLPYMASKGAFENNGKTIAYSPGKDLEDHEKNNKFPTDVFTEYVFVPKKIPFDNYHILRKYRNIVSCAECDAGIIIGGRIGTLNEFSNLYDFGKVIGVLKGSGGVTELIPEIVKTVNKDSGAVIIYENNPLDLVQKVFNELMKRGFKMEYALTQKEKLARSKVCLPLDGLNTIEEVKERVEELSSVVGMFKVGKESYTRFGPEVVKVVQEFGSEVFLDLKYHDIPNTVKGAANAATQLGVYMFNVHASGGFEMMKAAFQGAREASEKYNLRMPKVIGVTILTSIDKDIMNKELKINGTIEEQVLSLALLTQKAGLDGVVCSAADLYTIKDKLPPNFMYVTPGIKGPNTPAGADQKRVFTPGNAVLDGSSILVVGRAITDPPTKEERLKAGYEVLQDMARNL